MFKDITDYRPKGEKHWAVVVGNKVVASELVYADALRLAQRTKGSRVEKQ